MKSVIEKYQKTPFEYGPADCCQFVGECVESLRGYNPAKWFDYNCESGANELINSYGGLEELVTANLGRPIFHDYKDGDIALYDQKDGSQILGIVEGDEVILRSVKGLVRWPIFAAKAIWRT